ncbi:hypothetical protein ACQ858_08200 [Variovorax ureilyticus]|uniref:hypothetical protein n=1 Tax=Variovorax ureilyticus TaxID=1836198 RepID=UPI003D66D83A
MKTFEYRGDTITIGTHQVGKRFNWWYETGGELKGECQESGAQTEEAALREADYAARAAIDQKLDG